MTATTMRFGPEWMRKQPASAKPLATSPPPPSGGLGGHSNGTPAPPGVASYSALVMPHAPPVQGKRDIAHPFKYSRDEMLQFYKDGGGSSELPIEVERWEGIVREPAGEPVCLSDFTEAERKLYASSLNSELRRRQSADYMAQGERSKGGPLNSNLGLMGRRRRGDSNGADHPPLSLPRKTSWSGTPGSLASPSLVSPRTRMGSGSGFDGVLNGNDNAWGGRKRRIPSGQPFSGRVDEEEEAQGDPGSLGSKEHIYTSGQNSESEEVKSHLPREPEPASFSGGPQNSTSELNDTIVSMNNLTVNTDVGAPRRTEPANGAGDGSIHLTDLTKLQWSYIDPSGNVQGPFPGETMQLWHDQHYFTDNLMMKRIAVDMEFMPLAEIKRRAQGDRIFLSPLNNNMPPPGLGQLVAGPGLNSLLQRTGVVDSPRQPSPQAYGRSNTLDSLIHTGSTATGSASPSSSFGGNFARGGPISPDPVAIGSRLQRLASDAPINGRISAAGSYSSNGSPAMPQAVRHIFNEPLQPNRSSSFDVQSNAPWQVPQGNGIQGWSGSPDVSQLGQSGRLEPIVASPLGHSPFVREPSPYVMPAGPISADPFLSSSAPSHRFYGQPEQVDFHARRPDVPGGFQQVPNDSPLRFEGAPQQLPLPPLSTGFNHDFEQASSPSVASPGSGNVQHQAQTRQAPPSSPWGVPQTREPPRPRPFDADRPSSSNTFVVSLPQTAWNRPKVDVRSLATQGPWSSGSQANSQESQGHLTEEPRSLTTANVIQHNEQQGLLNSRNPNAPFATEPDTSIHVTVDAADTARATASLASVPPASSAKESASRPPASKRKGSTSAAVPAPEKAQPANSGPVTKVSATPSAHQKAAWATDDDDKAKQTSAPMNLREIQEVERKRQEARRTAEKERERAARGAAVASPAEEVQFTASWGLPTSQVSARSNSVPVTKDTPALSPATTSTPVWTNAAKPAAKTMKEIQEEEERRKQTAKEKETIASAARRAVQAPAIKGPPVNPQSSGGAWTVVGSGGKAPTPASVIAARPTPVTQTSTSNVAPARPAAVVSGPRPVSSSLVAKAAPSTPKVDDEPGAPSPEFMKWMRDSLRGLNSSVQFEEIAQMLLSFPLDPDKATKELIAETVYGASTTLDGRHFANEFVAKRKEDAHSRPRGARDQAANGRATSLADVVKAQPKQTQNEFGSFKVVKKKSKRS